MMQTPQQDRYADWNFDQGLCRQVHHTRILRKRSARNAENCFDKL